MTTTRTRGPERAIFYDTRDPGDQWGSTIGHLFGIAEAVYSVTGEVWEMFTPSPFTRREDSEEWPDVEYIADLRAGTVELEKLHHWYRVLLRYDALLRRAGLDY